MQKIPCLFRRNFRVRPPKLIDAVTPGCEWVLRGEGVATAKWDGTAVLVREDKIFARFDAKKGRAFPPGFEPCQPEPDPVTGHWPGWVLVESQSQYKWIRDAAASGYLYGLCSLDEPIPNGTYEAVGPMINGNPHRYNHHHLRAHGYPHHVLHRHERDTSGSRTYESIGELLASLDVEGIVFHHPDGRMVKIRRADYGLPWPVPE